MGTGSSGGHRAAFCIPIVVLREHAYNIFQRQTPDLAQKMVLDADTGQERGINLGEDYRGRKVDPGRDVWVLQVTDDVGRVKHAGAEADGLLRLLRLSSGEGYRVVPCTKKRRSSCTKSVCEAAGQTLVKSIRKR